MSKIKFNNEKIANTLVYSGFAIQEVELTINALSIENYEKVTKTVKNAVLKNINVNEIKNNENKAIEKALQNFDANSTANIYKEFAFSFPELAENKDDVIEAFRYVYGDKYQTFLNEFYESLFVEFQKTLKKYTPSSKSIFK